VILFAFTLFACSRFESKPEGYTGTVEVTEIEVASSVAGRIAKIAFDEGQPVNAGDLVFVLDVTTLEIQRDLAAAALETAKAAVESARAQIKTAGAGVSALDRETQRLKKMEEAGVGSAQQHSSLSGQRDVARAQREAADRLVNQALAAQGQAEAALRSAERALQEAQVHAAISGVVLSRNREPGEVVGPGASVITLGDLAHPRLRVYVPLETVETLRVGGTAKVYIDAKPDEPFQGTIDRIASEAEFTPRDILTPEERVKRVFAVDIALQPAQGILPGIPAEARFEG
jgi:HlyD family secretion protein